MVHQLHAIPRTKCSELQNRLGNTVDTPHWSLTPPDLPEPPYQPQGGTKYLPREILYRTGGPKRGHGPDGEPLRLTGGRLPGAFQHGITIKSLWETATASSYSDVVSGPKS